MFETENKFEIDLSNFTSYYTVLMNLISLAIMLFSLCLIHKTFRELEMKSKDRNKNPVGIDYYKFALHIIVLGANSICFVLYNISSHLMWNNPKNA